MSYREESIKPARDAYLAGRSTLEEFEAHLEHLNRIIVDPGEYIRERVSDPDPKWVAQVEAEWQSNSA